MELFQSTLPRRERLMDGNNFVLATVISIHAPAKGATSGSPCYTTRYTDFNPRSREGSDVIGLFSLLMHSAFQSTLPRRERLWRNRNAIFSLEFQSTLPRRERPACDIVERCGAYFNPRSREGSDMRFTRNHSAHQSFQSTLPRRERRSYPSFFITVSRPFQSTLPRRERR